MKQKLIFFFFMPFLIFAQNNEISRDFDGDNIADKVYEESEMGNVIYELSTQKFRKVKTDGFEDSGAISFKGKKNGFEIYLSQMRAGNSYQFRYEKETGKMRLIGMWRIEYGPANNDGSGESSVNLLTNSYIADWNYYDIKKNALVKIPTIKKKMIVEKVYFDNMGDVFSTYLDKDVIYYEAAKRKSQISR